MDVTKFRFPILSPGSIVFSVVKTSHALLEEAKARGFYNGKTAYNDLFNKLFFEGGSLNFKKDLDPVFQERATQYLRAFMGSFEPRHEDKEAICALLLSELVNIS